MGFNKALVDMQMTFVDFTTINFDFSEKPPISPVAIATWDKHIGTAKNNRLLPTNRKILRASIASLLMPNWMPEKHFLYFVPLWEGS